MRKKSLLLPFILVTVLFFMWGFITCMNDILIPYLKKMFELSRGQSMLVQMSFFGAYFVGSLIYFIVSSRAGDPIARMGYRNGLIAGLVISALGCILFFPAAAFKVYGLFLTALFVLGLGFTVLQIAANPYVAILGPPETASSRLNLSQAFNSFGTTIAPIVGGYWVFKYFAAWGQPLLDRHGMPVLTEAGTAMSAMGVQWPYLIFAAVFLLLAVVFWATHLPELTGDGPLPRDAGALRYRQLVFGMIAIFFYVGGEVSIGSVLINFLQELQGYHELQAKTYLAMYWGGAMTGRFLGAVSLGKGPISLQRWLLMAGIGLLGLGVIYAAISLESGYMLPFTDWLPFAGLLLLNLLLFPLGRSLPARTLMIFAVTTGIMLVVAMGSSGNIAMWSIIGIGLFNSIMWSNIFTLSIHNLGAYTSQASSLLVMAILGGAILPFVQGNLADALGGYHYSFIVPLISYLYLAWYGWKGYRPGRLGGIRN
ncbi:MAG: sugar MFS transporter [Lentimicrobiaceae bacterium]|nr:sugar MFS transporter [Lentimicrobiaceae bacterium]